MPFSIGIARVLPTIKRICRCVGAAELRATSLYFCGRALAGLHFLGEEAPVNETLGRDKALAPLYSFFLAPTAAARVPNKVAAGDRRRRRRRNGARQSGKKTCAGGSNARARVLLLTFAAAVSRPASLFALASIAPAETRLLANASPPNSRHANRIVATCCFMEISFGLSAFLFCGRLDTNAHQTFSAACSISAAAAILCNRRTACRRPLQTIKNLDYKSSDAIEPPFASECRRRRQRARHAARSQRAAINGDTVDLAAASRERRRVTAGKPFERRAGGENSQRTPTRRIDVTTTTRSDGGDCESFFFRVSSTTVARGSHALKILAYNRSLAASLLSAGLRAERSMQKQLRRVPPKWRKQRLRRRRAFSA